MDGKKYLPAVSTSLALAAGIGIMEAIVLSLGSGSLLNFIGIPVVRQDDVYISYYRSCDFHKLLIHGPESI